MTLPRCSSCYGGHRVLDGMPSSQVWRNALVMHNTLYDEAGWLITAACYQRGESRNDALFRTRFAPDSLDRDTVVERQAGLPPGTYVWLGYFHEHHGHFLISTLQRLWAVASIASTGLYFLTPILDVRTHLGNPTIAAVLRACGVSPDRIVPVAAGTLLPEVVVPEPAIAETSHVYRGWSDFMHRTGTMLLDGAPPAAESAVPAYLTRHRLGSGTIRYDGEAELVEALERYGVEILSLETMPIAGQVQAWRSRRLMMGFASSAFHNAAFATGRRMVLLTPTTNVLSNQVLINAACGHEAVYLDVSDEVEKRPEPDPGFRETQTIRDPQRLAGSMLRAASMLLAGGLGMPDPAVDSRHWGMVPVSNPFGRDIASECVIVRDGAADGVPCWDISLPGPHQLYEVRLYAQPGAADRPTPVCLVSQDGVTWHEAGHCTPQHGGDGHYRLRCGRPVEALALRVRLPQGLQLRPDGVELFALPVREYGPVAF